MTYEEDMIRHLKKELSLMMTANENLEDALKQCREQLRQLREDNEQD